jgi:hypothetical protein
MPPAQLTFDGPAVATGAIGFTLDAPAPSRAVSRRWRGCARATVVFTAHLPTGGFIMRLGKILVLATTFVLGLSGAGEASTLFTPLLHLSPGQTSIVCVVSNVSDRDMTVKIEAFSSTGADLGSTGDDPVPLSAGATTQILVAVDHARCKFTVPSRNRVRAHGAVFQPGVGSTTSAPAE